MTNLGRVLGVGALVAIAGCAPDRVSRYLDQAEGLSDLCAICSDITMAGHSEEDCRATIEAVQPTRTAEACLRRVYEENASELNPVADCQYEATSAWETCLRTAIETCPPNRDDLDICNRALGEDTGRCPLPSEATSAEINACLD